MFKQSILLLIALALLNLVQAAPAPLFFDPAHKKNIIFMVPDGFGPSGLTLARDFKRIKDDLPESFQLNLDPFIVGNVRTRSSSSLITDSAAAGTTYSTGFKTYNGAIGVDSNKVPKGTLMEALKLQGYKTGLVVKSTLTDATPSVWASHVDTRKKQSEIALQMVGTGIEEQFGQIVDYMSGGGQCYWLPQSDEKSCRTDDTDVIAIAKEKGFTVFDTKEEFDKYAAEGLTLPALSFWGEEDVSYALDRDNTTTPSLPEMAKLALDTLTNATKDSEQGFFIMIEGSLIDHCGHNNDAACHPVETLEFDETFKVVKDYIDHSRVDSLVIVAADHETGGLALGLDDSESYYPEVLFNKTHTSQYFVDKVTEYNETNSNEADITKFVQDWVVNELSVDDASDEEIKKVVDAVLTDDDILHAIGPITSDRASIGWSSGGHTAVDILSFFYTNSPFIKQAAMRTEAGAGFQANQEDTDLNKFLCSITGADLDAVTEKLAAYTNSTSNSTESQ